MNIEKSSTGLYLGTHQTYKFSDKPIKVQKPESCAPCRGYIILIGDEVTSYYMAMGYHYETVDIRHRESMPLLFENFDDALKYITNVVDVARYYANRIKNNVNRSNAIRAAKYELEKITSTNKSVIIPMIYDLLYHSGKKENVYGFYDYIYNIAGIEYMDAKVEEYEEKLKNQKEEEEKA